MERVFHKRELKFSEQDTPLPLSLPLVLPGQLRYDSQTHTVTEQPSDSGDATTDIRLVDVSLKLLRTIKKPIAVLSICGPYRTGKSYFLSRLLGSKETFKLGHSMSTCTNGIWMATSVLECDDFAIVLLDTEGIDSVSSSSAKSCHVTNLLTLTVLLSSTMIYNSRNVPRGRDVKKLSVFANLSKCIVEADTEQPQPTSLPSHLPHFIWLLRDIDTVPTSREGKTIAMTNYLLQLLESIRSRAGTQSLDGKVSAALLELFPTIQCMKLPPPSGNPNVLADIINSPQGLEAKFHQELEEVAGGVLQNVQPKRGYNTTSSIDGFVLATMLETYVSSINTPGKLPVLESTWRTAVELKLTHLARQLVDEYEEEMIFSVSPRFPLEDGLNGETGDTLLNAHLEIFAKKRLALQTQIVAYQPQSLCHTSGEGRAVLFNFDQQIVQYEPGPQKKKLIGGKALQFSHQNYQQSREFCDRVYTTEYQLVERAVRAALEACEPIDFEDDVKAFTERYWKQARGPAKENVYQQRRAESILKETEVKRIPGKPENLRIEGSFCDRIKLQWDAPSINGYAVTHYEVFVKPKGENMFLAAKKEQCSAVIVDLKTSTLHLFAVRAVGEKHKGKFGAVLCAKTDISKAAFVLTCATVLVLSGGAHIVHVLTYLPELLEGMAALQEDHDDQKQCTVTVESERASRDVQRLEQELEDKIEQNYSEYVRSSM